MGQFYVAIDFDGTIADHVFPEIGAPVPGAFEWMRKFQEQNAQLILWTMRADSHGCEVLSEALDFCHSNGIRFFGINENPSQSEWTASPKAYAHVYIDDMAFGCPLIENPKGWGRPMVDWQAVGPGVSNMISSFYKDYETED